MTTRLDPEAATSVAPDGDTRARRTAEIIVAGIVDALKKAGADELKGVDTFTSAVAEAIENEYPPSSALINEAAERIATLIDFDFSQARELFLVTVSSILESFRLALEVSMCGFASQSSPMPPRVPIMITEEARETLNSFLNYDEDAEIAEWIAAMRQSSVKFDACAHREFRSGGDVCACEVLQDRERNISDLTDALEQQVKARQIAEINWKAEQQQGLHWFTKAGDAVLKVERLEKQLDTWREREAACCPEDFGFDEYIRALEKQVEAARTIIADCLKDRRNSLCISCTEKIAAQLTNPTQSGETIRDWAWALNWLKAGKRVMNPDLLPGNFYIELEGTAFILKSEHPKRRVRITLDLTDLERRDWQLAPVDVEDKQR